MLRFPVSFLQLCWKKHQKGKTDAHRDTSPKTTASCPPPLSPKKRSHNNLNAFGDLQKHNARK